MSKFWLHIPIYNAASDWPCTFLHPGCFCLQFLSEINVEVVKYVAFLNL